MADRCSDCLRNPSGVCHLNTYFLGVDALGITVSISVASNSVTAQSTPSVFWKTRGDGSFVYDHYRIDVLLACIRCQFVTVMKNRSCHHASFGATVQKHAANPLKYSKHRGIARKSMLYGSAGVRIAETIKMATMAVRH